MANAKTNYFKVSNEEAFMEWVEANGFNVHQYDGRYMLDFDLGGDAWVHVSEPADLFLNPQAEGNVEDDEEEEGDYALDLELIDELAKFLQPGSVAVLLRAGGDSYGAVFGDATAVDSTGRTVEVSLRDVRAKAVQDLGGEVLDW